MRLFLKKLNTSRGLILVQTLVFSAVVVVIIGALASYTATTVRAGRIFFNREQAFQAAEAGIEYYRWHLAHAPTDYKDGTGAPGPYIHNLKDKNGITVGQFSLNITSPTTGSTIVRMESTGSSTLDSSFVRKIESRVAKPSIAQFAVAGNNAMRFGEGTEIFGSVHVNGGIHFDGLAHNVITSGATTYDDADHSGNNEIGVHTHVRVPPATGIDENYQAAEANPNSIPVRTDVFEAGRLISQPNINFSGFTADLAVLQAAAQSTGFYRDVSGAGYLGYHIVLKTNNTFDLYKITSWAGLGTCTSSPTGTGSYSIASQTLQGNYAIPQNGVIFIEDNVVVDGQVNGARVTITAAELPVPSNPVNYKSIIINNDISYTNYDGTDAIGLIGQGGVMVGLVSDDDLKIDGALIAQNNRVGRFYYAGSSSCVYKNRAVLSLYGMIASYDRYGFAYTDGTGYVIRNLVYDAHLLYAPPPNFPLTSDQYMILDWQEVK